MRQRILVVSSIACLLLPGCASRPEGTDGVLDPTRARTDMGTLVDISDILEISQKVVNSLRQDPTVSKLVEKSRPVKILAEAEQVKNLTSMTNFNKKLFLNQMLSTLNQHAGGDFQFLDRNLVQAERRRQQSGEVKDRGVERLAAGADLVLSGTILEVLDQRPGEKGTVVQTRSVQFSFRLVQVRDAVTIWTDSFFRVKQQLVGTVFS